MNDQSWHLDESMVRRYGDGQLPFAAAASVDAHLAACGRCQALVATTWTPPALDRVKAAVDHTLDAPPAGVVERTLRRFGMGVLDAKVIGSSLALQGSWIVAALVVATFAVTAADAADGGPGAALFLVLAPLVPLVGVGLAFGPRVDPTYEVAIAAPVSTARIVLLRTAAIAASAVPILLLLSALLPELPTSPLVWALPAVGLATASLALGTLIPIGRAAAGLAVGWLLLVGAQLLESSEEGTAAFLAAFPAFQPSGQLVSAAVAAIAAVLIVERRSAYEVER